MVLEYSFNFPDYPQSKAMLQEYLWHLHNERVTQRVGYDEILREALGKPLFGTAHGSKTTVSRMQEAVFRLLQKWFAVDQLKGTFTTKSAIFNERGYRKASYAEARRHIRGLKKSTWRWCIAKFRKAQIVHSYQDPKRGELWGAWWIRLNPCRIISCIFSVVEKRSLNRANRKVSSYVPGKSLSSGTRFSSFKANSRSSCSIAVSEQQLMLRFGAPKKKKKSSGQALVWSDSSEVQIGKKEKGNTPYPYQKLAFDEDVQAVQCPSVGTVDIANPGIPQSICECTSDKQESDSEDTRQPFTPAHRCARMDEVVGILSNAYPEVLNLSESDYRKIYRLVMNPIYKLRLDSEFARRLVNCKTDEEARDSLGWRIMTAKRFLDLIPHWFEVAQQVFLARLADHELGCFNDRITIQGRAAMILDSNLEKQFSPVFTQNGFESSDTDNYGPIPETEYIFARQLAFLLLRGVKTKITELLAAKSRDYFLRRPSFYVPLWRKFPELMELCKIPHRVHGQLVKQLEDRTNEIDVWNRISEHYGAFE